MLMFPSSKCPLSARVGWSQEGWMDLLECMTCGAVRYCKDWSTTQVFDQPVHYLRHYLFIFVSAGALVQAVAISNFIPFNGMLTYVFIQSHTELETTTV